jgi:hypothetical protein
MRADVGVMISASHNPAEDNGIKFFGPDGFKLSDAAEEEIEALLEAGVAPGTGAEHRAGQSASTMAASAMWNGSRAPFPTGLNLSGLRVVLDCANGAAYRAAPEVLWELGADVIAMGVSPDGHNINEGCRLHRDGGTCGARIREVARRCGHLPGRGCRPGDPARRTRVPGPMATRSWRCWPSAGRRRSGSRAARWWPP